MAGSPGAWAATDVAYVSLPPDSIPNGELAVIRNTRTGSTASTAMADGGFDPIAVEASAGDRLALEILVSGGGTPVRVDLEVPEVRKPRVVRTRPLVKKRDVVLNAVPVIVFSEPINGQTINPASVQLLQSGTPVSGRLTVSDDGLRAEFQPDQLLAPNTDYLLSVTTNVTDLTGDPLEQAVAAEFTTGTTTAVAMVYTDPAALFPVLNGEHRTWAFEAILHDDGRVTGSFNGFNPASGGRGSGRVTCFTVVDGQKIWVGGVFEELSFPNGTFTDIETGWIAADNGSPGDGVPDQLSYAVGIAENGFGTPQEFCDNTPPGPTWDGLFLRDVEVGDVVVRGSAPPPTATPLRQFSGNRTAGAVGTTLAAPFRVYVLDGDGNTVSGVPIEWAVTAGGGSITPAQDVTSDSHGVGYAISSATLTLGPDEGIHTATATAPTLPGAPQITFTATAVTVLVQVTDSGFVPTGVTVPLGRSVGWLYSGGGAAFHNVTFEDEPPPPPSSARLGPGMSRVRTFGTAAGTVRYRCTFHSSSFTEGEVGTVTVQDPSPPPSGSSGQITFTSSRDGHQDIYLINADGSGLVNLTHDNPAASYGEPAWSPDGKKIAFYRDGDIYVMNGDGTAILNLTSHPASDGSPAWAPDGTKIAFTSDRDGNGEIYAVNVEGSGLARLTNNPNEDGGPVWSPDGAKILFERDSAFGEEGDTLFGGGLSVDLYVMNADGSGVTWLTGCSNPGCSPSWSPDGTKIAFQGRVINADGSGPAWGIWGLQKVAHWSPDGTKIAFERDTVWGQFYHPQFGFMYRSTTTNIFVVNSDGTGAHINLTNLRGFTLYGNARDDRAFLGSGPWSSDGTKIAFSRDGDIYAMNADGTGVLNLTKNYPPSNDYAPAWRPQHP